MKKLAKRIVPSLLAAALLLATAACGSSGANGTAEPSPSAGSSAGSAGTAGTPKQTIRINLGTGHTARSMEYMITLEDYFMPTVQERVAAETDYEIVWNTMFGTAGGVGDALKNMQNRVFDMGVLLTSVVAGQISYHNFPSILPFTCNDPIIAREAAMQVYEEFPVLKDQLHDEFNQTYLAMHGLSTYSIYTTFPVNTVADLRGRTIGGSGRNLLWLEGTGAIPISQANPDTYTSIQTKLSEGQLAAASWGISFKFPEVCNYFIDCGLGACPIQPMTANNDFWNELPDEVRAIIAEEAEQWGIRSTQFAKDNDEASIEDARSQGCEVIVMTDEAKAEWASMLPNLPDVVKDELGDEGLQILKRYMEILQEKGVPVAREWTYPIDG